jgi:hypothetical protein
MQKINTILHQLQHSDYLLYSSIQKIIASACDLPFAGADPNQVLSELSSLSFGLF